MVVRVGMGEVHVTNLEETLSTTLGSCVAICLFDYHKKLGGMAHVVLPQSRNLEKQTHPCKFADIAVPDLISKMTIRGSKKYHLKAKITGGSNMFPNIDKKVLNIGEENIKAVKRSLKEWGIIISAEDLGGEKGRKIEFDLPSGKLTVERLNGETKIL